MERILSIINIFTNLIKLEHHRNFLESCKGCSIIPVGLLLKKVPSLVGTPSLEFQESWDNVLESAQSQLLALLVIQYRELLIGEEEKAFHHLSAVRASLTKEELAHVQEQMESTLPEKTT